MPYRPPRGGPRPRARPASTWVRQNHPWEWESAGPSGGWAMASRRLLSRRGHPMKIGIIGAGNIGGNLTRRLTALGHEVAVANSRGPQTLSALVEETGATAVAAAEAARGAEVVVVTVPLKAVPDLPNGLLDGAAEGVAVIDTGNYYPQQRDGRIAPIEDGLTESRWTEQQLGHPVVKAFNGTYAQDILDRPRPQGDPERIAVPVAGDDDAAKRVVRALIDDLGFDTVDAGGLDDSWRQQPGTPVYGLRAGVEGVTRALAEASPERPADHRA
ncbi:NADPH-dependent F420 reductase [Kitasatospora aureofaciens]|uniref:NADPH-dependent F420 reductase n=1 Tax=Kitasatospora aureofaciens TaxID=1894 RepID=UPI00272FB9ED|nr:NAD(P)-binding domain-containing protein [Kitasatospora aureofaciens]